MPTQRQVERNKRKRDRLAIALADKLFGNCCEVASGKTSRRVYAKKRLHPEKLYTELWNTTIEHAEYACR